jgi:transposase InsO family protein
MSVKLMAAVVGAVEGQAVNVSAVCREAGVSRKTFYKWVDRYRSGGLDGLAERSRRPVTSPQRVSGELEDVVVRVRKELGDAGLDHGATTIQWHLGGHPDMAGCQVPSVATVHRILVRRGLVTPQPKKRPKSSWKRFEAAAPNERWQIDETKWVIVSGVVSVFNIVDDHSRVAMRSRACEEATGVEAWATFMQASEVWGLPAGVLSDNGLCFSGKIRGFEVLFEANLRDAGVQPRTGRPYHPQTTGKVERFQQTLKKWLRRQPLAADLAELQAQLDEFTRIYNHERPHQGIARQIPIDRWNAGIAATPADRPLEHPAPRRLAPATIGADGKLRAGRFLIQIGVAWANQPAIVQIDGLNANVFVNGDLVRHLTIDPTRTYQPSGRKRGGPRQPRLPS